MREAARERNNTLPLFWIKARERIGGSVAKPQEIRHS